MSLDEATDLLDEQSPSQPSSPSPIPPQSPRMPGLGLFFSGGRTEEPEGLAEAAASLQEPSQLLSDDGSASAGEWPSSDSEDHEEGTTSSPASASGDGGGPLKPLTKAALKATTRKGVLIATSMAHRVAAKTELEKRAALYIADEQDQELIGDPIANLLHRRGGIAGGKMSEDANDALSGLMGVANYIAKQVALTVEIQRIQAGGQATADGEVTS